MDDSREGRETGSPEDGKSGSMEENNVNETVHGTVNTCNNEAEAGQLEAENYKLETKDMEVHHHPQLKHNTKPWKEYILEYIMIVLAVTTGFFAESLREHIGDGKKEKEYITSLKHDLMTDTANLSLYMAAYKTKVSEFDSLIQYLRNPASANGSNLYYLARLSTRGTVFANENNTITQLNSSGNFRLIGSKKIAAQIVSYEKDIENFKTILQIDSKEADEVHPYLSKLFDAAVFDDMMSTQLDTTHNAYTLLAYGARSTVGRPPGNPQLRKADSDLLNGLIYQLHQRKSTFVVEVRLFYTQKQHAVKLIDEIDKEYQLED